MDLILVGVSVIGSWKKKVLCVSPKAGPAQPTAPRGHYILYTTCVWFDHYFMINFRTESPVPRNRPLCHAGMDVARVSPIHPKFSSFLIHFTQNGVGVVPLPSSRCFSSVDWTRTLYFFPNNVRLSLDLVALLIFFDFDRTADSDGIPPMKAFPQCLFGWDSSDGISHWILSKLLNFDVPRIHRVPKSTESASIGLWNK